MTYLIGIDDAGRGPVIGPMVLTGVIAKKENQEKLRDLGARDSKLLTPISRKRISEEIKKIYKFHTETTSPKEIDESSNLNDLEAIKSAMIINKLSENITENIEVIIDCPSTNTSAWNSFVENLVINKKIKIKSEHKADFNHPIVSAASIIAKEKREEEMSNLRKQYKINFGSGYPADPITAEFIKKNHNDPEFYDIIRQSWSTVKKLKNKTTQKSLF